MRPSARQVLLNALAGTPVLNGLRRVRSLGRPPDHAAVVRGVLERFRLRRGPIPRTFTFQREGASLSAERDGDATAEFRTEEGGW